MGELSKVEWCDHSQNFWRGCDKVSPGCDNCYMFRDQKRYGKNPLELIRAKDPTFNAPLKWHRNLDPGQRQWVFTCSWSDFFIKGADPWRADAWKIIRDTPNLLWQILTKRPGLMSTRMPEDWGDGYPNVMLGVSVESQGYVHKRLDTLFQTPSALGYFVSAEPLLGPLNLGLLGTLPKTIRSRYTLAYELLRWVIVGGESGPGARPIQVEWVRDIVEQCKEAEVPVFVKQDSGPRPGMQGQIPDDIFLKEMPTL